MMCTTFVFSTFTIMPTRAFAWDSRYNGFVSKLRDYEVDYRSSGSICEQVARVELYRKYYNSNNYVIETGIMYGHNHATEGELDLVVFEKRSGKAVLAAEVKCSTNLPRAASEARKQRRRFLEAVEEDDVEMWRDDQQFSIDNFQELKGYWIIAQQGSRLSGFDYELTINLNDAADLRAAMIECQQTGDCRSPRRRGSAPLEPDVGSDAGEDADDLVFQ